MTTKLMLVDTETTGLDPKAHGVVQIAMLAAECRGREIIACGDVQTWNVAPFPTDAISPEAMDVHGLTEAQVRAYDPPRAVFGRVNAYLAERVDKYIKSDKYVMVAYNAPFDAQVLREWWGKCGDRYFGSWFWAPALDVMTLAMGALMHERAQLMNFKLGTVAAYLGVPAGQAHDAGGDVMTALGVLRAVWGRETGGGA